MTADLVPFEYAVLRVIPRVERGEMINAGVLLYCQRRDYLGARILLNEQRLIALDPAADLASVRTALESLSEFCDSSDTTMTLGRRFRWLTAPRSTIVQPGPVHSGISADPAAELDRLLDLLVR